MTTVRVDFSSQVHRTSSQLPAWSPEQEAIFSYFASGSGHMVVRARAGTGKTTTIVEGVNRAPEQKILLAAFNKSIAQELTSRVKNPKVEAKTLHGLGFAFIRRAWTGVQVDSDGKRAESLARASMPGDAPDPMVRLVKVLHTKAREMNPRANPQDLMDLAVRFDLLPDEEWEEEGYNPTSIVTAAHRAMLAAKEKTPIIDFADMIYLPVVCNMIRPWYNLVVVDEAQDMTESQLELATRSCKRDGRIVIVGDDRQAIYAFRGADSGSLDRLKASLKAHELGLKTTYRCPQEVVRLAQEIVPDFVAAPSAPQGLVASCKEEQMVRDAKEGDFILSRKNAPLVGLCIALLREGRRARIKGRDIGKGITALIRKQRVNTPQELIAAIQAWGVEATQQAMGLGDAAEERIQFVQDQVGLITELSMGCATIAEVLARCESLFSDDAEKGSIMLSTVHRAKGLEADNVYLLKDTFRQGRTEEDNVTYVAITRAKARLIWCTP